MTSIIGWDIGGVHLKAALVRDGTVEAVEQLPCTLWLGVEHLADAWRAVVARFGEPDRHAVTMTGELAEIFDTRETGVRALCHMTMELAGGTPVRFHAGTRGFLDEDGAARHWGHVASNNFDASARVAGRAFRDALFIDIGSTTTDIIPVSGGNVVAIGETDAARLETGELVYTGVTRTSLMALAGEAPIAGRRQRLMAENFATTADVFRLTGELAPEDDSYPASDGRTKSQDDCRARIARMFGRDLKDGTPEHWDRAARYFRERQLQLIGEGVAQVLSAHDIPPHAPFIGAGAGGFLVPEIARRLGRACRDWAAAIPAREEVRRKAGVCAPAVAVALLAVDAAG